MRDRSARWGGSLSTPGCPTHLWTCTRRPTACKPKVRLSCHLARAHVHGVTHMGWHVFVLTWPVSLLSHASLGSADVACLLEVGDTENLISFLAVPVERKEMPLPVGVAPLHAASVMELESTNCKPECGRAWKDGNAEGTPYLGALPWPAVSIVLADTCVPAS